MSEINNEPESACQTCGEELWNNECLNNKCETNKCTQCRRQMDIITDGEGTVWSKACVNSDCKSNKCPYCQTGMFVDPLSHQETCFDEYCPGPHVELNEKDVENNRVTYPNLLELIQKELVKKCKHSPEFIKMTAETIISYSLSHAVFHDERGNLRPNIITMFIAPSGFGKTPVATAVSALVEKYNRVLGVDDSTPEIFNYKSMSQYITGRQDKDRSIPPHPFLFHLVDEASLFISDSLDRRATSQNQMFPYLCKLYDGHNITSYKMSNGIYGGGKCYYTGYWLGTPIDVLPLIDNRFLTGGLGARMLWCFEEKVPVDDYEGVVNGHGVSDSLNDFIDIVNGQLKPLSEITNIKMTEDAGKLWTEYSKKKSEERSEMEDSPEAAYLGKLNQLLIKLSSIYAAARHSYVDLTEEEKKNHKLKTLWITQEDITDGITDLETIYYPMFLKVINSHYRDYKATQKAIIDPTIARVKRTITRHDGSSLREISRIIDNVPQKNIDDALSKLVVSGEIEAKEIMAKNNKKVLKYYLVKRV